MRSWVSADASRESGLSASLTPLAPGPKPPQRRRPLAGDQDSHPIPGQNAHDVTSRNGPALDANGQPEDTKTEKTSCADLTRPSHRGWASVDPVVPNITQRSG